jgi:hypothetical protein
VADKAGLYVRLDAAGGKAGYEAAKLDLVIYKYVFYYISLGIYKKAAENGILFIIF